MSWLNPALWNNIGVVGLAVVVCAGIVWSVSRGVVIPRSLHQEIVKGKDSVIEDHQTRAAVDAETIKIQAQTIAERNGVEDAVTRLLQATRNAQGEH